jgi:hypothetical protein
MVETTHDITRVAISGEELTIANGKLTLMEPEAGETGVRSWQARLATRSRLPSWVLRMEPDRASAEVTAGGVTFTGAVAIELKSSGREMRLISAMREPEMSS